MKADNYLEGFLLTQDDKIEIAEFPEDALKYLSKQSKNCKRKANPMPWIRAVLNGYSEKHGGAKQGESYKQPETIIVEREMRDQVYEAHRFEALKETLPESIRSSTKVMGISNPFLVDFVLDPLLVATIKIKEIKEHMGGKETCEYCVENASTKQLKRCNFYELVQNKEWCTKAYAEYQRLKAA